MSTRPENTPPARRRGELFAHSELALVWAAVETLSPGQQHELFAQLGDRVALPDQSGSPHERRVARAVAALREAADLLEAEGKPREVSVADYRRLRDANPQLGWPPDGSIRRWMGGRWNDALAQANLDAVPEGDVLVTEYGPMFFADEIVEAVQDYAEDARNYYPTLQRFLAWAKRPDVKRRPGRRPTSQGPFDRLFGSWSAAVAAAQLHTLAAAATTAAATTAAADGNAGAAAEGAGQPGGDAAVRRPLVARARYSYDEGDVQAALQLVAERLGRSPKVTEYAHARAEVLDADLQAGRPLSALPSNNLIQQRYATWDEALVAAGLAPTNGRHVKLYGAARRSSKRVTDEQILEAIRWARREISGRMTQRRYRAWRSDKLAEAERAGRHVVLPEMYCIWQRFGGWLAALELALGSPSTSEPTDETP